MSVTLEHHEWLFAKNRHHSPSPYVPTLMLKVASFSHCPTGLLRFQELFNVRSTHVDAPSKILNHLARVASVR